MNQAAVLTRVSRAAYPNTCGVCRSDCPSVRSTIFKTFLHLFNILSSKTKLHSIINIYFIINYTFVDIFPTFENNFSLIHKVLCVELRGNLSLKLLSRVSGDLVASGWWRRCWCENGNILACTHILCCSHILV